MRIGLWSDCHHFPSLPLMKLSAYHKARGDSVELWAGPLVQYDILYASKTFTESPGLPREAWADQVIRGGTGFGDLASVLPDVVEHSYPDYGLYPEYRAAYGFLTRGCPRGCPFCVVGRKEGRKSVRVADLSEFWRGQREIKLLDPNLLACSEHTVLLEQLADSGAWVDFTQGLDIRLMSQDNVALLNRIKTKMLHFAWDDPKQDLTAHFMWFNRFTNVRDNRRKRVYVLTNYGSTQEEDLYRVNTLRQLGYDPYVMVYDKAHAPHATRRLQRWCNCKRIFWSEPDFERYGRMEADERQLRLEDV